MKFLSQSPSPCQSDHLNDRPAKQHIGCVMAAMEIIGAKWTSLIIKNLASHPRRFCELQSSIAGINPRTLSQRLEDLEQHGVINKQRFNETPPRCEYSLTTKGQDLLPVLRAMADWGDKYPNDQKIC